MSILKDRNCFITGATGGIGRCIAHRMAELGCVLSLTSAHHGKLKALKAELVGSRVYDAACDLNDAGSITRMLEMFHGIAPRVDILINCAGVHITKPLGDMTLEDYTTIINVNLRAPFILSQAFAPGMVQNNWGRIVNIASECAYNGHANSSVYCASKHALLGLSRSLHEELREHNVRVFSISPGATRTPMLGKINRPEAHTFIEPREIAQYIAHVISFDSTMVSEEVRLNRMTIPGAGT